MGLLRVNESVYGLTDQGNWLTDTGDCKCEQYDISQDVADRWHINVGENWQAFGRLKVPGAFDRDALEYGQEHGKNPRNHHESNCQVDDSLTPIVLKYPSIEHAYTHLGEPQDELIENFSWKTSLTEWCYSWWTLEHGVVAQAITRFETEHNCYPNTGNLEYSDI